jgi:predicted Zn-ribbon and HTH transcriptional regulator
MLDGLTQKKGYSNPRQGQINFAPVKPLQHLKENAAKAYEHSSFHTFARELHTHISNKDLQPRREIAEIGRLVANLRSGKLIMQRDPVYGSLSLIKPQLPQKPRSDRHVYSLAQVNSSQLTSIWTISRPRAVTRDFGNTNKAQIQRAILDQIIRSYDANCIDELFHQRESLSMMDYGTAIIRVSYDERLNQIKQLQPVIENSSKSLFPGYGYCRACGFEGTDADFAPRQVSSMPSCPQCGSFDIPDLLPEEITEVAEIVGVQEITQGDISIEMLPVPACNWDLRVLAHESSYFQYRSIVPVRLVETILGIEVAEENEDADFGLEIINALGRRGGTVEGYGRENLYGHRGNSVKTCIMDEEYFSPEWYAGERSTTDEKTISGELIPKGTPYEKIFPDGLCLVGFNDMQVLAGAFNEKRRITGGVYHIQSHSGVGKGISDAIEISEQLNMAHSAAIEQIKRTGAGGGFGYDRNAMNESEARKLIKPGGIVGLDLRKTNYTSIQQALWQVQHNELSQSNMAMIAQLSNLINISFQTTDFTSGVADQRVDVNTLGGQQLLQAQNQQRSAAPLRMKGYTRARVFEDVLEVFREYIKIPKFFGNTDKFSLSKGRKISGADLPDCIKCDYVTDSELPTNDFTKRENVKSMLAESQGLGVPFMQVAVEQPRIAMWWASKFGVDDMPLFNHQEILIVCQDRIDNLLELCAETEERAEISGYYPTPEEVSTEIFGAMSRPLYLSEENHALKAQVLSEYLDDDEVTEWTPLMRQTVEALIDRHYQLDAQNRTRIAAHEQNGQLQLQMQAANAQMQMQAQQYNLQNQLAAPQQEQEAEQQMLNEGLGRAADLIEKEEDFAREQEGKDLDHQRNLEIQRKEQEYERRNNQSTSNGRNGSSSSRDRNRNRVSSGK